MVVPTHPHPYEEYRFDDKIIRTYSFVAHYAVEILDYNPDDDVDVRGITYDQEDSVEDVDKILECVENSDGISEPKKKEITVFRRWIKKIQNPSQKAKL